MTQKSETCKANLRQNPDNNLPLFANDLECITKSHLFDRYSYTVEFHKTSKEEDLKHISIAHERIKVCTSNKREDRSKIG
jgi:hypothetical protein